jgi:hypothetical protein
MINIKNDINSDNNESIESKIHSFSILNSTKAIELHANYSEYKTTLSNE